MKIRSSIKRQLLRQVLIKGTILAICGVLILLFAGIFIPSNWLQWIGPFLIIISLLLITLGLYPYQQLKKLETKPHEITLIDEHHILFSWKQNLRLIIPLNSIDKMEDIELDNQYGIALFLKNQGLNTIKVSDPNFSLKKFQKLCQEKYGCDLFLPYFSKRSFDLLQEHFIDSKLS